MGISDDFFTALKDAELEDQFFDSEYEKDLTFLERNIKFLELIDSNKPTLKKYYQNLIKALNHTITPENWIDKINDRRKRN